MGQAYRIEEVVFIEMHPAGQGRAGGPKFVIAEMGRNSSGRRPSTCRRATTSRRACNLLVFVLAPGSDPMGVCWRRPRRSGGRSADH